MKNKSINTGSVVNKYNIALAILEKYLIPTNKWDAFQIARSKQELNACKKYGKLINT